MAALVLVVAACESASTATTITPDTTPTTEAVSSPGTSAPGSTLPPTTVPSTSTSTSTTLDQEEQVTELEIRVASGEVVGGGRLQVDLGAEVRLVVVSDVSDEVHLHGYDLLAEVGPDQEAVIEFTADIPGVFELELEQSRMELARLEIAP